MLGLEQFLSVFGGITVTQIVLWGLAILFLYKIYIEARKYLIKRYESEKEKNEQLKTCLDQVKKYPEYRQQSIEMQKHFQTEIDGLKKSQIETTECLKQMEEKQERRERNKLRDKLLQSYRYYTDENRNPSQTWTRMESEAFWELFRDYEDMNGDGYIHTVVQPAMNLLKVVEN